MVDLIGTDELWGAVREKINSKLYGRMVELSDYLPANPSTATCTAAIVAAAADAIAAGVPLRIRSGQFYMASVATIDAPNGLHIVGDGADKSLFCHDSQSYMFDIRGGTYGSAPVSLTANAAAGDTALTVSSTASFSAKQWLNLQSNQVWDASSGKAARYGELVQVKAVTNGTTLTLYSPLDYAYTTANGASLTACPLGKGLRLEGFGLVNRSPLTGASGAAGGLVLRQAERPKLTDLYGEALDGPMLTYSGVVGGKAQDVSAAYLADDETNGRYGYVHNVVDATRGFVIDGGHSRACRHHVTTNAGSSSAIGGVPAHITVSDCQASAYTNAAYSTHEEGDDIVFTGCRANNGMDMGYEFRAPRSKAKSCEVVGGKGTGFLVQPTAVRSELKDVSVFDLTGTASARGNPTTGISLSAQECVVSGFHLRNIGNSGLRIGANRQQISDGRIHQFGVSTNVYGIHWPGASIDSSIRDVNIDGGGSSGPTGLFNASTVTGTFVSNVKTRAVSTPASGIANLTSQTVNGSGVTETVLNSTLV
ncbi:hypothetical protein [Devosia submarina]|uniref:hypothetical protein n=1 Tax=Devosia submarina TaxID=1173082 RepID=UPI000D3A77B4|nr:hypothetical protein [Devosia submarina]